MGSRGAEMNVGDIVRYRNSISMPYYGIIIEIADLTVDGVMLLVLFDDGDLEYENDWQLEKINVEEE